MTVEIQLLDPANADLLDNIAPEVFDRNIEPLHLRSFLDCPRHIMSIAVANQTIVGMASAVEYFHPDKPPQLWINEIGVASTHRRQRIGQRLVQALIDVGLGRGCVSAWLGTDNDNLPAQACFSSVPDGEKPQPFLLYEWDLEVQANHSRTTKP